MEESTDLKLKDGVTAWLNGALNDPIVQILAKNSQLLGYVHRGLWTDIGSEEGLKTAESIVDKLNEKE